MRGVPMTLAVAIIALTAAGCGESASSADERWRMLRDSTLARTEVAAARIGDAAYVVGGFAPPDGATTAVVERYDLRRDRWTRVAPIPQAVNHAAAVAHRGAIYVLGGYTAANGLAAETNAFWRYDPGRDRWSRMPGAPSARGALVAGVIGNRLYAVGGARAGGALRTLEIFDFGGRRWSTGRGMAVAREHLAGAVLGGAFYALAGRAAGRGNFRVVERYDPARDRWQRVASMRKPRGGIAAAAVNGRIVVVGGEEGAGTIAEVESFRPRLRRWRTEPRLPTPRHGLGAVSFGGRIFVLEGGPQPGLTFSDAAEVLRVAG